MRVSYGWGRRGAIGAFALLAACGDLTRSDVERILNGEGRGSACESSLQFNDGGFEKAKATGAFTVVQSGLLGGALKVADTPDGDQWQVACTFGLCGGIARAKNPNRCLPGKVEVQAIADAPFAPGSGSYKLVEFVEVVTIPSELSRLAPYVQTRYSKSAVFQKTDNGWRVAR